MFPGGRRKVHWEKVKIILYSHPFGNDLENILFFKCFRRLRYLFWFLGCCCVKSVRIRNYSGPYSVRMRKNADQNNSEYGTFYAVYLSKSAGKDNLHLRIYVFQTSQLFFVSSQNECN